MRQAAAADSLHADKAGAETLALMQPIKPRAELEETRKPWCTFYLNSFGGQAEYVLGDFAAGEHIAIRQHALLH